MSSTIIVIDGSIGVGKSSLLDNLMFHCLYDSDKCYFYKSPLNDYDEPSTISREDFYIHPNRNFYGFHSQVIKSFKNNVTHPEECIQEDSIHFHDTHLISCLAYCRAGRNMGYLSNSQYEKLKAKIRTILSNYPCQIPQYVIRLISTMESSINCIRRHGIRGECRISKQYLQFIANSQFYWNEKLERAYGIKTLTIFKDASDSDVDVIDKVWNEFRYLNNKGCSSLFEVEEGIFQCFNYCF